MRTSEPHPRRHGALAGALLALLALAATSASAQSTPVSVVRAERAPLTEILALSGTLTSPHTARVASEVSGRVQSIAVEAGERVAEGDPLLTLDDALARLELAQAEAARREAAAELADARRRLAEVENLAQRQSVAASEVQARESEVRRDRAVLERRNAERDYRQALVERHTLTAPFAGVISERMVDLGEWVGPETPVLELVEIARLRLDLRVPQDYFGRVQPGTPLELDVAALEQSRAAEVTEVVPVSDPAARTFPVRARLDNADGRLAPGMSARARLRLDTGERGIVVPRDALIRYPDGRVVVWVVDGNGPERSVSERAVTTGLTFDGRVAIREGLQAGETVVTRGNEALRAGQTVRIEDAR